MNIFIYYALYHLQPHFPSPARPPTVALGDKKVLGEKGHHLSHSGAEEAPRRMTFLAEAPNMLKKRTGGGSVGDVSVFFFLFEKSSVLVA